MGLKRARDLVRLVGGRTAAERCRRGSPRLSVSREPVRAELGTARDQRGQVGHGLDRPRLGHTHEPVRVEVVAQQERRVRVTRSEQPWPSVVEQVALVDRLEAERVRRRRQLGEDRLALALLLGPQRLAPKPALARRLVGDRPPEVGGYSQPASSFVQ